MKKPLKRSVEPSWSKVIHNAIGKKPEGRYQIGGGNGRKFTDLS
jgi:hypothetical protein